MIHYTEGDILKADAEAIVNTVNCVGVMGRGIALQFKKAWPENFKAYKKACDQKQVIPGKLFVFQTGQLTNPRYIINFPTKRHWRLASRIEDVEAGLVALKEWISSTQVKSIAIPPLGAGLGGLNWAMVKSRIEAALMPLPDINIYLYEPKGAPQTLSAATHTQAPKMTAGRSALIELMHRYLKGLMDPSITLLEVHKLMYFMQEAGEPLRLNFQKGHYGPYAENLRHVLSHVEGHFIVGYADGGDQPGKELTLAPGAVDAAQAFLQSHPETCSRFDRVSKLVDGFETPFGLELLATTHWVMKYENAKTPEELRQKIHDWNTRKRKFTARQIAIASNAVSAFV